MKLLRYFLFIFLISTAAFAQEIKKDSIITEGISENDTLLGEAIELPEIIISNSKLDRENVKQFMLLQNRVYKVYPYAKIASERLTALDKNMSKLKTNKELKS